MKFIEKWETCFFIFFSIGYSHSSNSNAGWKTYCTAGAAGGAGITATKNWQTNNGLNYPRQQYNTHPQQTSNGQTQSVVKILYALSYLSSIPYI